MKNDSRKLKFAPKKFGSEYYKNLFAAYYKKIHPLTVAEAEQLTIDFLQWADETDSIVINDFYLSSGYPPQDFADWRKKFPFLEKAWQLALRKIGSKRETLTATFVLHPSTMKKDFYYDPEYAALAEELNKNKGLSGDVSVRINVTDNDNKPLMDKERKVANDLEETVY